MVSNPEGFTNNSPISPMTSTPVKKPNARKSLCIFTNILYLKEKTSTCRSKATKSENKVIESGTTTWELNKKRKVNSRINDQIKKSLYNWIMHHPQVVQSPIVNDCLKVNIDGNTKPQLVPDFLLQFYARWLHNSLVSVPVDGGRKEAIDVDDNIIISDSTLLSLLPPQLKKYHQDTRLCVVANVTYMPKVYIPNYYHGVIVI